MTEVVGPRTVKPQKSVQKLGEEHPLHGNILGFSSVGWLDIKNAKQEQDMMIRCYPINSTMSLNAVTTVNTTTSTTKAIKSTS